MIIGNHYLLLALFLGTAKVSQQVSAEEGERWAVVVAGSSNYWNYGDQACACHAYHLLHNTGIPDDHIVVMMYDDIAYNKENPVQGSIINEPDGPNVYSGVIKDYTKDDVTPGNFLKVLSGDEKGMEGVGSGKVVKSGPNDRIFVFFNDHGSPGFFCFPHGNLYATDFADVVLDMHTQRKYKEMVVYMDSCYSGSMFKDLYPEDIGFYAVSSANEKESAYNCCYDDYIGAYLAAEFSLAWMKTTEWYGVTKQTIGDQYEESVKLVESSHVMKYSQMDIQNETLSVFFGPNNPPAPPNPFPGICPDSVSKSDLYLATLERRLEHAEEEDASRAPLVRQIALLKEGRRFIVEVTTRIVKAVTGSEEVTQTIMEETNVKINHRSCYEKSTKAFTSNCFELSENNYALQMLPKLLNLCESGYSATAIVEATEGVCTFSKVTGVH